MDAASQGETRPRINPINDNVIFASATHRWSFTLRSFAQQYREFHHASFLSFALAKRLWGNVYFDYASRRFQSRAPDSRAHRSFVQFCLEPL
jgi:U5 small nuclear ribonucleoprotein component